MSWRKVKLKEVLKQVKISVEINSSDEYKLVTVSNKGIIKLREIVRGFEISANKAFIAQRGNFIYSRLSIHNGAFGIIPSELDNALLTSEMPSFICSESIIPEFLLYSLQLQTFKFQLEQLTKGVGRSRVKEEAFLNLFIDLPSIFEQNKLIGLISSFENKNEDISFELTHQLSLIKQLRQSFLREAMQGKLLPQIASEGNASDLLAKIKAEKQKLIAEKKLKKEKDLPAINADEIPFEIPENWVWCRLGDILEVLTDYHANGAYEKLKNNVSLLETENYAIMLRTTNFHIKNYTDYKYITEEAYNFLSKSKVFSGDVIMNKIGDPGTAFFVDDRGKPMSLAMNLFLIRFKNSINNYYAYSYLKNQHEYIKSLSAGTTNMTITKDVVKELLFPLPPLSEQQRIVAKLKELMAYCDKLEKSISDSKEQNEKLLQQVLREALRNEK